MASTKPRSVHGVPNRELHHLRTYVHCRTEVVCPRHAKVSCTSVRRRGVLICEGITFLRMAYFNLIGTQHQKALYVDFTLPHRLPA